MIDSLYYLINLGAILVIAYLIIKIVADKYNEPKD